MARIAGVDLPNTKRVAIGLTYILGIGDTSARKILDRAKVDGDKRVKDLTDEETSRLRTEIESSYRVEGALRAEAQMNIKRLMDIGCYRGLRHRRGLPVNGQRTKTNARTRKGPKKGAVAMKKKAAK